MSDPERAPYGETNPAPGTLLWRLREHPDTLTLEQAVQVAQARDRAALAAHSEMADAPPLIEDGFSEYRCANCGTTMNASDTHWSETGGGYLCLYPLARSEPRAEGLRCSHILNGCRCGRKPHDDERHVWMNTLDDGAAVDPAQYPDAATPPAPALDVDAAWETGYWEGIRRSERRLYILSKLVLAARDEMPERLNNHTRVNLNHAAAVADPLAGHSCGECHVLEAEYEAALAPEQPA